MHKIIESNEKNPYEIELDPNGYFIIRISLEKKCIYADFYNYSKEIIMTIKGYDARNIYWSILENDCVSMLSHAMYLGKELTRAEFALLNKQVYKQK